MYSPSAQQLPVYSVHKLYQQREQKLCNNEIKKFNKRRDLRVQEVSILSQSMWKGYVFNNILKLKHFPSILKTYLYSHSCNSIPMMRKIHMYVCLLPCILLAVVRRCPYEDVLSKPPDHLCICNYYGDAPLL